ncbi:hypothetical protein DFH94DRAFT_394791 [Russula ochroleuca]|uniref:Secreted protein n=1 Tax=Russula ochroleuca TaxID=152965 RepID=A0A9P5JVY9_9AGAM|nr:hypothetical protein DFH94DRAFT_394791 [Russula ochroleuca]
MYFARRNGAQCCNLSFFLAVTFLCFAWDASNVALLPHVRPPFLPYWCTRGHPNFVTVSCTSATISHSRPNKYSSTTVLHKLRTPEAQCNVPKSRPPLVPRQFFSPLRCAHTSADGYICIQVHHTLTVL